MSTVAAFPGELSGVDCVRIVGRRWPWCLLALVLAAALLSLLGQRTRPYEATASAFVVSAYRGRALARLNSRTLSESVGGSVRAVVRGESVEISATAPTGARAVLAANAATGELTRELQQLVEADTAAAIHRGVPLPEAAFRSAFEVIDSARDARQEPALTLGTAMLVVLVSQGLAAAAALVRAWYDATTQNIPPRGTSNPTLTAPERTV